jgi:3-deoxy-manno-octulosonate cytidylyltransferase (CMP-KDO synthetase)
MKIIGIIPARMASTRFPGKPLCKICGITMIEHVYKRSVICKELKEVYVATCDKEIFDEVIKFGGKAIMTSDKHKTCSDRVAEACRNINSAADIIVNIQGDEPLTRPEMISASVAPFFSDKTIQCVNLIAKIKSDSDFSNPNVVKVVKDKNDYALYFSRESIPSNKKFSGNYNRYRQVCILPFTRSLLLDYVNWESTPLETIESVDMMRLLENGYKIKLVETFFDTMGVDNEDDRLRVEALMSKDKLFLEYKKF